MRIEEFIELLKDYNYNIDCSDVKCEDCVLRNRDSDICDKLIEICNELSK